MDFFGSNKVEKNMLLIVDNKNDAIVNNKSNSDVKCELPKKIFIKKSVKIVENVYKFT